MLDLCSFLDAIIVGNGFTLLPSKTTFYCVTGYFLLLKVALFFSPIEVIALAQICVSGSPIAAL